MKSKDKSSEQRFGRVNVTNRNSYLNIIFLLNWLQKNNKWKPKKLKLGSLRFLGFQKHKTWVFKTHFYRPGIRTQYLNVKDGGAQKRTDKGPISISLASVCWPAIKKNHVDGDKGT